MAHPIRRAFTLAGALMLAGCHAKAPAVCPAPDGGPPTPLPYVTVTPAEQELWVVDITNETPTRELLARTLQDVVNRKGARMYLIDNEADPTTAADSLQAMQQWLTIYAQEFGLKVTAQGNLDDALAAFGGELDGYYLISEDEPWTVNAGCSAAATGNAVVASSAEAPELEAMGLPQLDSFVGRWPDALASDTAFVPQVQDKAQPGFAIMLPTKDRPRDFFVQQGIVELSGDIGQPEWAAVQAALARTPGEVPIYGWPSQAGGAATVAQGSLQELDSVTDISNAGDALIAFDSTPNLSFHVALHPKTRTLPKPPPDLDLDCDKAELNVVVALSDGDNQVLETVLYQTSNYWLSPQRGQLPINWSISPATATLAPAVFDYYARTLAPGDELVEMIGAGYAYGSALPDPNWFYALSFQLMDELGLRVLWLFDPLEEGSGTYSWKTQAERVMGCGLFDGLLDGYYPPLIYPDAPTNETVGTVPIIRAQGSYSDGPPQIAQRIQQELAIPRAQRPRVVFYSAAAWSNTLPGLVAALAPLQQQGVRFVSASAGMKCVAK